MTRTHLLATAVATALCVAAPGAAFAKDENIDFREPTCSEFIEAVESASEDDVAGMMLWLDGYVNGLSQTPVIDWARIERFYDKLLSRCQANGDVRLINILNRAAAWR